MTDPLLWTWDYLPGANVIRLAVFFVAVVLIGLTVRVTVTAWRAGEGYRTWASTSYALLMFCVAITVIIGYGHPLYIVPTAIFATAVGTGVMGARTVFTVSNEWKRLRDREAAAKHARERVVRHAEEDVLRAEDRDLQDGERADSRSMEDDERADSRAMRVETPEADLTAARETEDGNREHSRELQDDERAHRRATGGDVGLDE
jgi:hypothetical protein